MPQDTLATLMALDPAVLTGVVCQDQRSPRFRLHDWTVAPLSHHKIIDTTGGLFRFSGHGYDAQGERPWSVVLKIVNAPGDSNSQQPRNWAYWKREVLAFQSGLLANLPGPLRVPRCYGVQEIAPGAWIWMEHIVETSVRPWGLDTFRLVAQHVGAFNAAYLRGTPRPATPWLTDGFLASLFAPDGFWAGFMDPQRPGNAWEIPITTDWYPEAKRQTTLDLWTERETFIAAADRLPQAFSHHDAHCRNMLVRERSDGQCETVALDWAFCGRGQVGADAAVLVATSLFYFEREPETVAQLEAAVLDGYVTGLRSAGWEGDPRFLRLGYVIQVALWWGLTMPGWTGYMLGEAQREATVQHVGRSANDIAAGWLRLWEYAHACADEARALIGQLKLG